MNIVAIGGGGFMMDEPQSKIDQYIISLSKRERPKVCFLPTACGDASHILLKFYSSIFQEKCSVSHLPLFKPMNCLADRKFET